MAKLLHKFFKCTSCKRMHTCTYSKPKEGKKTNVQWTCTQCGKVNSYSIS